MTAAEEEEKEEKERGFKQQQQPQKKKLRRRRRRRRRKKRVEAQFRYNTKLRRDSFNVQFVQQDASERAHWNIKKGEEEEEKV